MNYKHGKRHERIYQIWCGMIQRCRNPSNPFFPEYGGRGIFVCHRWCNFQNFYEDMGDPPEGMSIERIDNDRGYEPENCKWATRVEQNRNRRRKRILTVNGESKSMSEWAEIYGLKDRTIWQRLSKGWTEEEAVTIPVVSQCKGAPRGTKLRYIGAERGVRFSGSDA